MFQQNENNYLRNHVKNVDFRDEDTLEWRKKLKFFSTMRNAIKIAYIKWTH